MSSVYYLNVISRVFLFGETIINILLFLKKEKRSNNEICFFVLSELAPNELKQFKLDIQEAFQKGF